MSYTRRKFLTTSIMSAGFVLGAAHVGMAQKPTRGRAGITLERRPALPPEVLQDPVLSFKPETFTPYVGGIFTSPNALGEAIELQLMDVTVFKPKNPKSYTNRVLVTESFSLTFKAAAQLPPFTSIYRINHPSLGEFSLFLTKREAENGDILYDAVINHLP